MSLRAPTSRGCDASAFRRHKVTPASQPGFVGSRDRGQPIAILLRLSEQCHVDPSSPANPPAPVWPCEGCGYNVHDTRDAVCPECGRGFDASEFTPERMREKQGAPARWVGVTLIVAQFAPTILPLMCCGLARLQLGHWPRPTLDTPNGISGVPPIQIVWAISLLVVFLWPSLVALHVLRWSLAPRGSQARRTLRWWILASIVAWPMSRYPYRLVEKHTPILEWLLN